jgi:hypothetical protein
MKTALNILGFALIFGGAVWSEKSQKATPVIVGIAAGTLIFFYTGMKL